MKKTEVYLSIENQSSIINQVNTYYEISKNEQLTPISAL